MTDKKSAKGLFASTEVETADEQSLDAALAALEAAKTGKAPAGGNIPPAPKPERQNTSLSITEAEALALSKLRQTVVKAKGYESNITTNKIVADLIMTTAPLISGDENILETRRGWKTLSLQEYVRLNEPEKQALRDEFGGIRIRISVSLSGDALVGARAVRRNLIEKRGGEPLSMSESIRASILHIPDLMKSKDLGGMCA